jgi:hypothetical protein
VLALLAALSAGAMALVGVPAVAAGGAAPAPGSVTGNSCNGVFHGAPQGSLVESSSAGPSEGVVEPGQTITVRLSWSPSDFSGGVPEKTAVCVEIGSQISASLSQEHKPGPPGGSDTYSVEVPAGGTGGAPICVRGSVSGTGNDGEKSAILCYALLANPAPEVPQVLLLPLTALLVGGGALLVARRRRTGKRLQS